MPTSELSDGNQAASAFLVIYDLESERKMIFLRNELKGRTEGGKTLLRRDSLSGPRKRTYGRHASGLADRERDSGGVLHRTRTCRNSDRVSTGGSPRVLTC